MCHVRLALVLGLVLYNFFGILDWSLMREAVFWPWMIRYGIFTPVVLTLFFLSFCRIFQHHYQAFVSIPVLLGGLGIVAMIALSPPHISGIYYAGLILVFFYGYTFLRARFIYASITSLIIVCSYELSTLFFNRPNTEVLISNNFFFLSANLMGMFISYFLEHAARSEFLMAELLKNEREKVITANIQLSSLNSKLHLLSDIDDLTQIANRRVFEETLGREWARLVRERQPISLIMCDIDFFKKYNDHYGHQKGDECLKMVSNIIRQAVRRPADLVARYGGEEFIILLPGTDCRGAQVVAQNILNALKAIAMVHAQSPISEHLTISMGIAHVVPDNTMDAKRLVGQADEALYQAKARGRNQYAVLPPVSKAA